MGGQMLVTVKLKLITPFLGSKKPDHQNLRRLEMHQGQVLVRVPFWQEQFQRAATELQYDVDVATIQPPERFRPATIRHYRRTYSRVNVEWFESFQAGTVLTLDFVIQHLAKRAPNPQQLAAILRFTGQRLGLSPWGSKFGLGRFELMELKPTSSESYETPTKNYERNSKNT